MWPLSPVSGPLVWVGGTTSPPFNFICRVTLGPVVALAWGATISRVAVVVGRFPALAEGVAFLLDPQAARPSSPTSRTDTRTTAVRLRRIIGGSSWHRDVEGGAQLGAVGGSGEYGEPGRSGLQLGVGHVVPGVVQLPGGELDRGG